MSKEISLNRNCEVIQIPSGTKTQLPKGTPVIITQSLGGAHTITHPMGLARVEAKDQDALGMAPIEIEEPSPPTTQGDLNENWIWDRLKTVYDPEIPVNIVDLGLVYSMNFSKNDQGQNRVEIKMTLTAPGCGMGPTIANDAKQKVLSVPGVAEADVEIVWDPPWNQNMITEAGRMKLGLV